MTKPISVHKERWTSLDGYMTNIFTQDFCHENQFSWRARSLTLNGATVKIRQHLNLHKNTLRTNDEIRFWFPVFDSRYIYIRMTNETVKVHYDHGLNLFLGAMHNFYASLLFKKNWSDVALRLGITRFEKNWHLDSRVRLGETYDWTLYNRFMGRYEKFRFGCVSVWDFQHKSLLKKDFLLGYLDGPYEVYLKGSQDWRVPSTLLWADIKSSFNKLSLIAVYTRNMKESYGVEVSTNPLDYQKSLGICGVMEYRSDFNNSVKVKIDHLMNLAFMLRRRLNEQLQMRVGTSMSLTTMKPQVGLSVDLNI